MSFFFNLYAQNISKHFKWVKKKTMAIMVYLSDYVFLKCGENQKQPWAENTKYHKDLIILDFPISLCLWVQRRKLYGKP